MIKIVAREDEHPAVVFKKLADAEAEIKCQVFFSPEDPENPKEEDRLQFETGPVPPKFKKVVIEDKPGWTNFFIVMLAELKP